MSPPPLPTHSGHVGSTVTGVLLFLGACVTGVLGYFGVRSTRTAPLQEALNGAFRSLVDELQADSARLTARISELEDDQAGQEGEIRRLRGVVRGLQQREASLIRFAERAGMTV